MNDLIARLERASEGSHGLNMDIVGALGDEALGCSYGDSDVPDFTGSIDAARMLAPAGCAVEIAICPDMGSAVRVYQGAIRENSSGEPTGYAPSPALALCIAALRARQHKSEAA